MLRLSRETARERALEHVKSGKLVKALARLVAVPSVSQSEGDFNVLGRYLTDHIDPLLQDYGFSVSHYDNPVQGGPPFLIGHRIEDPALPTILIYGHGDVCNAEATRWRVGLESFTVIQEGDRLYGRGTADNKIQHLINFTALGLLIQAEGRLGFNVKVIMEMGEEMGSPGLSQFLQLHREDLAADVLISSDGPRLRAERPTAFMGSRGAFDIEFNVTLRDRDMHSGNFGGVLADPVILLTQSLACVTNACGEIQIPEWRPDSLTPQIQEILAHLPQPANDPNWGEGDLSPAERLFGWNSFAILAIAAGNIEGPQSAICAQARAVGQLRFVVGTDVSRILPALRRHLDAHGFTQVQISQYAEVLHATRFSLDHPWVRFVCESIERSTLQRPDILPNLAGSLPNEVFTDILGLPTIWIPHSYAGCCQHGPDEHALVSIATQGLCLMTDLFLDIAQKGD